jgi:HD-like signal output (HDOD) protein
MGDLPTLPHMATKVIDLVSDPNSSTGDLEKVIASCLSSDGKMGNSPV